MHVPEHFHRCFSCQGCKIWLLPWHRLQTANWHDHHAICKSPCLQSLYIGVVVITCSRCCCVTDWRTPSTEGDRAQRPPSLRLTESASSNTRRETKYGSFSVDILIHNNLRRTLTVYVGIGRVLKKCEALHCVLRYMRKRRFKSKTFSNQRHFRNLFSLEVYFKIWKKLNTFVCLVWLLYYILFHTLLYILFINSPECLLSRNSVKKGG